MANVTISYGEAKAICDALEVSPSQHQPTSPLYVGSAHNPEAGKKSDHKASADKGAEQNMGVSRKPAVHQSPAKNKSISKAT